MGPLTESDAAREVMMARMKKKSGGSKLDLEQLNADIERYETISVEDARQELIAAGLDPQKTIDTVMGRVNAKLTEWRKRGVLHQEGTLTSPVGAGGSFLDAGSETLWSAWRATHGIAERIREAETLSARRAVIRDGFEHLDVAADALRTWCAVDHDAVWPVAESLEEAAIEVAQEPALWDEFGSAYADVMLCLPSGHQCMFVHGVKELLHRGEAARHLAAVICRAILRSGPADEARLLITTLAHHHGVVWKAVEGELTQPLPSDLHHLAVDIEAARREALEIFPTLRAANVEATYFETSPVVALFEHLDGPPPGAFLAMYALGDVYVCAGTLVTQDPAERQKAERSVFAERMLGRLRDDSASHFVTVETFEPFRDRYPVFAASLMARMTASATARARQALFVCLVEGYEDSFAGIRQRAVPHFELSGDAPRFVAGAPHGLDLYGERVCSGENAHELRPHMEWANRRLSRWVAR